MDPPLPGTSTGRRDQRYVCNAAEIAVHGVQPGLAISGCSPPGPRKLSPLLIEFFGT